MKDIMDTLTYKGKEYKLIFNLNVLQEMQDKYGTMAKCLDEAYGKDTGEPSLKALSFMVAAMINEAIDINNDEKGEKEPPVTEKMVNRMLSEFLQNSGDLTAVVGKIDDLMAKSLQGGKESKNE